ncbi:GNAT family N-acetyltransferase [Tabrizicola sp. WMC-M-20]|nr:GNAT family N-acetyltransferase [Tabrizicola sp. WMC-M-20]
MNISIRSATAADEAAWRGLWQDYLTFYEVTLPDEVTAATWARCLDPSHRMQCRLAFDGAKLRGFAIHHAHCSSWVVAEDVYLEDLFVTADSRGQGVGRALIEDLVALGKAQGWHRLYWHTHRDNAVARRLYDTFCEEDGHIRYRVTL